MFKIKRMIPNTLRVFDFGFYEVGYVDVEVEYQNISQILTIGMYSVIRNNTGLISSEWYPMMGIRCHGGAYDEFSDYVNNVLTNPSEPLGFLDEFSLEGCIGWIVTNLFKEQSKNILFTLEGEEGYSYTTLAPSLKKVAKEVGEAYRTGKYHRCSDLTLTEERLSKYNDYLYLDKVFTAYENTYSQLELMNAFVKKLVSELESTDGPDNLFGKRRNRHSQQKRV